MTFHSKSIVTFGQLLVDLSVGTTRRVPISGMLDCVKEHFSACAVVLSYGTPRGERHLVSDRGALPLTDAGCPTRSAPLREMLNGHQYVSASEAGSGAARNCSIWIFRDREDARFDNEESALVGIVLSQIARTLDVTERRETAETENALYADALASLHVGVVVADETGRIMSLSGLAKSMLAAREGLQIQGGKLRATNVAEDRELQGLIRACCAGEGDSAFRGLSFTRSSGLRTLGIMARPVPASDQAGAPLVCIYLRDFALEPQVEGDTLRQIFDLTPAEAAMTRRLAAGLSLEDAAISLDISRNTARAHLRSIFSKNGISRQTELVRMVLSSATILGSIPAAAPL